MAEPRNKRLGYEDSLNLTTSICLTYTLCVAILRAWVRRSIYGVDDIVIGVATIIVIGLFASDYLALGYGAGKPWANILEQDQIAGLNGASIAGVVTFVISLYASKCAVISFLLRLTKAKNQIWLYWITIGIVSAFGLASLLIVTVGFPLKSGYYWAFSRDSATCSVQSLRWDIFTAFDIFTEVILIVLPAHQIWGLQMPIQKKATVLAAFNLRLPVIALSVGRMIFTQRLCNRSNDPGLASALVLIWLAIETSYAIVSNTFSALRAFTMDFNSSFGLGFTVNAGPESFTMSRMKGNNSGGDSRQPTLQSNNAQKSGSRVQESEVAIETHDFRPEPTMGRSYTQVTANRHTGGSNVEEKWRERNNRREQEDQGILRETEYTVQTSKTSDEMPILNNTPFVGR